MLSLGATNRSRPEPTEGRDIRKQWPRQTCLDCACVYYQSFMHYVAGDW